MRPKRRIVLVAFTTLTTMVVATGFGAISANMAAAAGTTSPCDNPTKSVQFTRSGGVTGDTEIATLSVVNNADQTQTATWPVKDSSYVYCVATGTEYFPDDSVSARWSGTNDGSADAQFYQSNPNNYLDGITVTFAQKPASGVTRFAGNDRYSTAAAVSAGSFPGTASDVFLVTGEDWPDALAAGAAAAEVNGPVLPVQTASIPGPISAELNRLKPTRAWVVGGTSVVNEPVLADLRARGITVERVSGGDRYSTAAAVARKFFVNPPGAYYASGAGYADALGGGAAAAKRGWPLLLTVRDSVPAATPILGNERIALGGTAAISDAVVAQLQARRVAGGDRFATAAAVARDAFSSAPTIYLATGLKFPDALAGTVAAARDDAPILLTLTDCVTQAAKDAATALGGTSRVVLGGTAVVTDQAANLTLC